MKKFYSPNPFQFLILSSVFFALQLPAFSQQPAFPGAEGFGKFATGGRYGSVYRVTNLNNSGAGSLRDAVSQANRIVVFSVAGVIRITERMVVSPNIYIAGQTAPGEGITVYGNGWSFSNAHNTICRYMRIRMGNVGSSGNDAVGIADGKNMVFDHCSISWGRDETFSINSSTSENITIQNCVISQGLLSHSAGGLIQAPGGITLYRNVYVDNSTRNNKFKGIHQYVNNMVYNWQNGAYIMGGDSQGESFANAVGNLFIQGPVDGVAPFSGANAQYHIYENDNLHDNNRNGVLDPYVIPQNEFAGGPDFKASPYNYPVLPTVSANTLMTELLPGAGASLPYRDLADYYVINEVKSLGKRGEFIAKEDVMPFGAPTNWTLWPGVAPVDTDTDGMPDAWEIANSLNPNSAADAMLIASNGYTNLENYINGINASHSQEYLRAPLNLKQDSATQSTIYLSWFDYTEKETGYIVERKVDGIFTQIGTTAANVNTFAVTGLQPEEKDTFRVRAFNVIMESGNSNELIAKTKPVEVPVIDPETFVPDITWTAATDQNWDKTTLNWKNMGNTPVLFADSSKLLFAEAGETGQTIQIGSQMGPKDMVIKSAGAYTFSGAGPIAGSGSFNKTGTGTITFNEGNTYTGATVLHNGVLSFNQLANGGMPSSIGGSANYGFNWVWKGGSWNYTGGNTSTDRFAVIDQSTGFSVSNAASTVTFNGELSGVGGLIKEGPGRLVLRKPNFYEGETVIRGGILEVTPLSASTESEDIIHNGVALGTSNKLRFEGGTFRTSGGSTTIYENYPMDFFIKEGTINNFEPYRNANLMMNVSGSGTLNYAITYSRELIQGDWSGFTGQLVANGVGTGTGAERSMLMVDNGSGFPNARVHATGNTKITCYSNNQTIYLGGLSGTNTTTLACGDRNAGGAITWVVGAAKTNETFDGQINNEAYLSSTALGTTSIVKEGEGIWRLTNNNIYSGTTTIEEGVLVVNGNHNGAGNITVNAGALAGTGSLTGNVIVVAGAIEPGDSSIGTLTLKGNADLQATSSTNIDIDKQNSNWDKLNVNGNLNYNGILKLNILNTIASGDEFKIFTVGGVPAGNFTGIVPAEPGPGLQWLFTPATGILAVVEPGFVKAPSNLLLTPGATPAPGAQVFIGLTWTDNSDNELHFVIERGADGENFLPIGQALANATSYNDMGELAQNTEYFYRVKAIGETKQSAYTPIVSATTFDLNAPPQQPANPVPANGAENVIPVNGKANLAWTGSGNTVTYSIFFGTDSTSLTDLGDLAYTLTPTFETPLLEANTTYYWRIDAANANGPTIGKIWMFRTAGISQALTGDYRTLASGNWGSSTVATAIWETYNGTTWDPTAEIPGSGVNSVTIRSGHTVTMNATTAVTNLVIENGATLKSGLADGETGSPAIRNLRVRKSVANLGTFGSSSTTAERLSIEAFAPNGTIFLSGTNRYNVGNFNVNPMAEQLEVLIDADMNLSGNMRSYSSQTPSGTPSQDDDNVTITINTGKTVTMGSSGYLQFGSSPTSNTLDQFGKYTYNVKGTLDMRSTGTSCIVAHSTKADSKTTINISGTWLTGNAMRLVSAATTQPVGGIELNIIGYGVVDAGARTIGGSGATNLVQANGTTGQVIPFNISDSGVLRNRVANSNVTFHVASGGIYSPVRLNNAGTADMVNVGVYSNVIPPVTNADRMVQKQYNIAPAKPGEVNLTIGLGWMPTSHGSLFDIAQPLAIAHFNGNNWNETDAAIGGAGTMASPYYATAAGFTAFSPFIVVNKDATLPVHLLSFEGNINNGDALLQWRSTGEMKLKHYEVERSLKGQNFEQAGIVSARNISTGIQQYYFNDGILKAGIVYYRLKMLDLDGSYKYSPTIALRTEASSQILAAFPNPAHNNILITHAAPKNRATLNLYSAGGKLISSMLIATGSSQTNLRVGNLPAGMYIISVIDEGISNLRFVKE